MRSVEPEVEAKANGFAAALLLLAYLFGLGRKAFD
jgi:hypothetical protein